MALVNERVTELEAKLEKAVDLLEWQASLIERNITPNGTDTVRLKLPDGTWHTGPVVNWVHDTLTNWEKVNRSTIAELKGQDDE